MRNLRNTFLISLAIIAVVAVSGVFVLNDYTFEDDEVNETVADQDNENNDTEAVMDGIGNESVALADDPNVQIPEDSKNKSAKTDTADKGGSSQAKNGYSGMPSGSNAYSGEQKAAGIGGAGKTARNTTTIPQNHNSGDYLSSTPIEQPAVKNNTNISDSTHEDEILEVETNNKSQKASSKASDSVSSDEHEDDEDLLSLMESLFSSILNSDEAAQENGSEDKTSLDPVPAESDFGEKQLAEIDNTSIDTELNNTAADDEEASSAVDKEEENNTTEKAANNCSDKDEDNDFIDQEAENEDPINDEPTNTAQTDLEDSTMDADARNDDMVDTESDAIEPDNADTDEDVFDENQEDSDYSDEDMPNEIQEEDSDYLGEDDYVDEQYVSEDQPSEEEAESNMDCDYYLDSEQIMTQLASAVIDDSGSYIPWFDYDGYECRSIASLGENQTYCFSVNADSTSSGSTQYVTFDVEDLNAFNMLQFNISGEDGASGPMDVYIYVDRAMEGNPDYYYHFDSCTVPTTAQIDINNASYISIVVSNSSDCDNTLVFYDLEVL